MVVRGCTRTVRGETITTSDDDPSAAATITPLSAHSKSAPVTLHRNAIVPIRTSDCGGGRNEATASPQHHRSPKHRGNCERGVTLRALNLSAHKSDDFKRNARQATKHLAGLRKMGQVKETAWIYRKSEIGRSCPTDRCVALFRTASIMG